MEDPRLLQGRRVRHAVRAEAEEMQRGSDLCLAKNVQADGLHLNTAAQASLGTRLADAARALEAEAAARGPAPHS